MSSDEERDRLNSNSSDANSFERLETIYDDQSDSDHSEFPDSVFDEPTIMEDSQFDEQPPLLLDQPFLDDYEARKQSNSQSVVEQSVVENTDEQPNNDAGKSHENDTKSDMYCIKSFIDVFQLKLPKFVRERRFIIFVGFLFVLAAFACLFINLIDVSTQLEQCEIQRQELVDAVKYFDPKGQFGPGQIPQSDEDLAMSLMKQQDLYLGKCKKLRFKTLEKLGLVKPGHIVICI